MQQTQMANYKAEHFLWQASDGVGTITLNRPERKNPLTFDSYAELRDLFRALVYASDIHGVVIHGAGGNFCSGGDVHEIIGPLTRMSTTELLAFTRMTGDLVKAMRACPQPIISAVEGVCAGAGAIIAMASDLRYASSDAKVAFLFNRVGLAGCDMGACSILPRIIGQGRASELLYFGRSMSAEEGERWGFFNAISDDALGQPMRRRHVLLPARHLPMASPKPNYISSGLCPSTKPLSARPKPKRCACRPAISPALTTRLSPGKNPFSKAINGM